MKNIEYGKIVGNYMLDRIINTISPKMALKRKSKHGYITKISPEVRYRECDISSYLNHGNYNDLVLSFQKNLETKLSHCNNNAFYENIKRLFIREFDTAEEVKKLFDKEIEAAGTYDYDGNGDVSIYKYNMNTPENYPYEFHLQDITSHELVHMAATYKKGIIRLSGFHQSINESNHVGMGLNEGYTELLNERYFSHAFPTVSYVHQKSIAMGIEEIVGQKKMEQLYFDADLNGLIEALSLYISKEEAINLIREIDDCHNEERKEHTEFFNKTINIRQKIAKIQNIKNKQLLEAGKITKEEFEFNELRSTFYKAGEILEKDSNGYKFRYHDSFHEKILSPEAYRILQNTAKQTDRASDLVICAHKLNTAQFRDNKDLSNIATIELSYEEEKGYRLVENQTKKTEESNSDELADMLADNKTSAPTEPPKKAKN